MKKSIKKDYWSGKLNVVILNGSLRSIKKELKKWLDIAKFSKKELSNIMGYLKEGCSIKATPGSLLGNDVVEVLSDGHHYKTIVCQDRDLTHNQALCFYL